jgi:hypothetical protein
MPEILTMMAGRLLANPPWTDCNQQPMNSSWKDRATGNARNSAATPPLQPTQIDDHPHLKQGSPHGPRRGKPGPMLTANHVAPSL